MNADGVAAEVIGEAHGGDIHAALEPNLRVGQIAFVLQAGVEFHPALFQPRAHAVGLGLAHLGRLVIERGLAEALLEDAARVQRAVGNNGVEHAHAAFIKHAQDRFLATKLRGEFFP